MDKFKYQKPEVVDLTKMDAFGECADGAGTLAAVLEQLPLLLAQLVILLPVPALLETGPTNSWLSVHPGQRLSRSALCT
jgi:hypothetical protein